MNKTDRMALLMREMLKTYRGTKMLITGIALLSLMRSLA